MFKKILSTFIVLTIAGITLTSCSPNIKPKENEKISIVTTLFPQYDFARQIVGDKADIVMLLPAGVESHSYEPSPADIIKINSSNLFIYTGQYMEPWAKRIIDGIDNKDVMIVDASANITLGKIEDHDHEEEHKDHEEDHDQEESHDHEEDHKEDHEHNHDHEFDPHVWTDPNNAKIMVDNIVNSICEVDPANAEYYRTNATHYKAELDNLDKEFKEIVRNRNRDEIIFGGRFAFYYFIKQYGLEYEAAYDSCFTETEPSVKVVSELIDEIKEERFQVIYYEELSTPKVAQSISDETGVKMLLLHSCHNVSKDEFQDGITYLDLMKQNAKNLKEGLK